jgi:hypothetical protein
MTGRGGQELLEHFNERAFIVGDYKNVGRRRRSFRNYLAALS